MQRGSHSEPRSTIEYLIDAICADAILFGEKLHILRPALLDFFRLNLSKFGIISLLAAPASAVGQFVSRVFFRRLPRQMARVHTSQMTVPAFVCSVEVPRVKSAVGSLAHLPVDITCAPIYLTIGVAIWLSGKRPDQTFFSREWDGRLFKVPDRLTALGSALFNNRHYVYTIVSHTITSTIGWLDGRVERCNAPRLSFTAEGFA